MVKKNEVCIYTEMQKAKLNGDLNRRQFLAKSLQAGGAFLAAPTLFSLLTKGPEAFAATGPQPVVLFLGFRGGPPLPKMIQVNGVSGPLAIYKNSGAPSPGTAVGSGQNTISNANGAGIWINGPMFQAFNAAAATPTAGAANTGGLITSAQNFKLGIHAASINSDTGVEAIHFADYASQVFGSAAPIKVPGLTNSTGGFGNLSSIPASAPVALGSDAVKGYQNLVVPNSGALAGMNQANLSSLAKFVKSLGMAQQQRVLAMNAASAQNLVNSSSTAAAANDAKMSNIPPIPDARTAGSSTAINFGLTPTSTGATVTLATMAMAFIAGTSRVGFFNVPPVGGPGTWDSHDGNDNKVMFTTMLQTLLIPFMNTMSQANVPVYIAFMADGGLVTNATNQDSGDSDGKCAQFDIMQNNAGVNLARIQNGYWGAGESIDTASWSSRGVTTISPATVAQARMATALDFAGVDAGSVLGAASARLSLLRA